MSAPDYVFRYDYPDGHEILRRDGDGDYVRFMPIGRHNASQAREIVRALNELEKRRRINRREAARKRRERAA